MSTFDTRAAFSACRSSFDVRLLVLLLSFSDLSEFSPRTKPGSGRGKMKSVLASSYNSNILYLIFYPLACALSALLELNTDRFPPELPER